MYIYIKTYIHIYVAGHFWAHVWAYSGPILGQVLGPMWAHLRPTLGPSWAHAAAHAAPQFWLACCSACCGACCRKFKWVVIVTTIGHRGSTPGFRFINAQISAVNIFLTHLLRNMHGGATTSFQARRNQSHRLPGFGAARTPPP
jgi:hypothetical protein